MIIHKGQSVFAFNAGEWKNGTYVSGSFDKGNHFFKPVDSTALLPVVNNEIQFFVAEDADFKPELQDDISIRQAFEVEQQIKPGRLWIGGHVNYTFEWNPELKTLLVFDTTNTNGVEKRYYDEDSTSGAWDRFKIILTESQATKDLYEGIFIHWVNPDTIKPISIVRAEMNFDMVFDDDDEEEEKEWSKQPPKDE